MDFFEDVVQAPADAILGLSADFAADKRKNKVNLGAGVYKTAALTPFILDSVKKAEMLLIEKESSKDYLPIEGLAEYIHYTKMLVYGKHAEESRIFGAQTPGGTAALRLGGNFFCELGIKNIYISSPTWANHQRVFEQAGMHVQNYPYFNRQSKGFDFAAFLKALRQMEPRSAILLQASCHNPTGIDPTREEWQEICQEIKKRELFPFFDLAYQGFGESLSRDVDVLSLFLEEGLQYALAVSNSKNFGLYAERCGALFIICRDEQESARVASRVKVLIRGLYSNPPCHGARIVAAILQDADLRKEWEKELAAMRERILEMRRVLVIGLQAQGSSAFDFLAMQRGMFSYTLLSKGQVDLLITEYGIYLPGDGRINVAGLNDQNMQYVIDAIVAVSKL